MYTCRKTLFIFRQPIAGLQDTYFYLGRIKFLHVERPYCIVANQYFTWFLNERIIADVIISIIYFRVSIKFNSSRLNNFRGQLFSTANSMIRNSGIGNTEFPLFGDDKWIPKSSRKVLYIYYYYISMMW